MQVIIDRFEEGYAVLQMPDGTFTITERKKIPECSKEGDILIFDGSSYSADIDGTLAKKSSVFFKFNSLKSKK